MATATGTDTPSPNELAPGEVVAIADGDTFDFATDVGKVTVRLLGVNAPERDECFHDEAARGLALQLASGAVAIDPHGLDQFGRTLAYVWTGDTFVNLALVASGLAFATTPDDDETQGSTLLAAEAAAYEERVGLWSPTVCGGVPTDADLTIEASGVNPPGDDADVLHLEHVTIVNRTELAADISGWTLRDESSANRYSFPDDSTIRPGSAIDVASDDPGWRPGEAPVWNNRGDMALLLTSEGAVVARRRFGP